MNQSNIYLILVSDRHERIPVSPALRNSKQSLIVVDKGLFI
ncbi:hypothetical protein [Sediminibacillus albus]|nr:hypothetical protein [Sediminibacillus albus]